MVGAAYAQAAARARGLPITGVSHLAGHVYSAWLADAELEPPFVALVVSGGHTDTIELSRHGEARRLASTRDDAVGVLAQGEGEQPANLRGHSLGQPLDGTEVEHAELAVRGHPEVARVRVRMQQARACGSGQEEALV